MRKGVTVSVASKGKEVPQLRYQWSIKGKGYYSMASKGKGVTLWSVRRRGLLYLAISMVTEEKGVPLFVVSKGKIVTLFVVSKRKKVILYMVSKGKEVAL